MILNRLHLVRMILPAMGLAILGAGQPAGAQVDDENAAEADAELLVPARATTVWSQEQFETYLFGNARSDVVLRAKLDAQLAVRLREIERDYALTSEQRKRLLLAAEGDIKHFFDRAHELNRRFRLVANDALELRRCVREAGVLARAMRQGIFDDQSLLAKILAKSLTRDQIASAREVRRAWETARYKSAVAQTVDKLNRALRMSAPQRRALETLLLYQTRPPRKSGESLVACVMYQATRVPKPRLEAIFEQDQWNMLSRLLSAYENMEEFLKDEGFVLENPPDAGPAALPPVQNGRNHAH